MKLFVYGTLLRGESNHHVLEGATLLFEGIKIQAKMYDTNIGYPAIELEEGSTIVGEVYEIQEYIWSSLDALEGYTGNPLTDMYSKEIVKVETNEGLIEVIVYTICDVSMKSVLIPSGNWIEYRSSLIR
ncbi:gamma-glutamylcyclotransferase [Paenisporosarcina sp. TG20]|uniref:gamma-glutamylcyclotransferase family protein n=1 Tax=Paenisporosarcina sp. TG20 TaxID=1211706 RepID=UPI0002DE9CA7|nr:gamma-glutamylcyclotransferase family protein [Paenisporosarcina sp. TG20]